MSQLHPAVRDILSFFRFDHLPAHLASVSAPFCHLAHAIALGGDCAEVGPIAFGRGPLTGAELTVALRKLLEAKDAAVRAAVSEAP